MVEINHKRLGFIYSSNYLRVGASTLGGETVRPTEVGSFVDPTISRLEGVCQ